MSSGSAHSIDLFTASNLWEVLESIFYLKKYADRLTGSAEGRGLWNEYYLNSGCGSSTCLNSGSRSRCRASSLNIPRHHDHQSPDWLSLYSATARPEVHLSPELRYFKVAPGEEPFILGTIPLGNEHVIYGNDQRNSTIRHCQTMWLMMWLRRVQHWAMRFSGFFRPDWSDRTSKFDKGPVDWWHLLLVEGLKIWVRRDCIKMPALAYQIPPGRALLPSSSTVKYGNLPLSFICLEGQGQDLQGYGLFLLWKALFLLNKGVEVRAPSLLVNSQWSAVTQAWLLIQVHW